MDHPALHLAFDGGTLVVTGPDPERLAALPHLPVRPPHRRLPGRSPPLPRPRRAPAPREGRLPGRRPAPTSRRRGRCAPAAIRSRTRPRRWKPGGTPAAAASSCCRPAPARPSWPSSPSTRPAGPPSSSRRPSTCSTSGTASWLVAFDVPVGLLGGGYYDIPAADRHDLRFGLHPPGTLGQPLRPAGFRRVPPPAGPVVHGGGRSAASPRSASA